MGEVMLKMAVKLTVLAAPDIPNPGPSAPPGMGDVTNTIISWLQWGALAAGVILIIVGAISYGGAKASGNPRAQGGAIRAIGGGVAVVFIATTAAFWVGLAQKLGSGL